MKDAEEAVKKFYATNVRVKIEFAVKENFSRFFFQKKLPLTITMDDCV
jgi:hypothetical protein